MEPKLNRRLDERIAREIKALFWNGATQDALAARFNISQTTVSRIVRGKQWADIPWPNGDRGALPIEKIMERKAFGLHAGNLAPLDDAIDRMEGMEITTLHQMREVTESLPSEQPKPRKSIEELEREHAEHERLLAIKNKAVEQAGEQAEADMNAELEGLLTSVPDGARAARPDVQQEPELDILSWEYIEQTAKRNRIVLMGRETPALRPAICQAFTALPESEWKSDRAFTLVREVAELLTPEENNDATN